MCDRSREFHICVEQFTTSTAKAKPVKLEVPTKSLTAAFNDAAAEISRGIHKTSTVLTKLTQLVKRQGLFDDPTEEINSLIYRIKQDLGDLNTKCDTAQQYVDAKKRSLGDTNQESSHNVKVVSQLKTDLLHATKDFKTVLEMRSSKMKDQQQRKVELAGNSHLSPMRQFKANSQLQQQSRVNDDLSSARGSAFANPYMDDSTSPREQSFDSNFSNSQHEHQQLLLAPPAAAQYFEAREKSVTEVEKTIGELGQLFKRLATMINEQQELVERIDEDIENSVSNAERARSILAKTYESVSSNRGLYLKLSGIIAIFMLFFVLFLM